MFPLARFLGWEFGLDERLRVRWVRIPGPWSLPRGSRKEVAPHFVRLAVRTSPIARTVRSLTLYPDYPSRAFAGGLNRTGEFLHVKWQYNRKLSVTLEQGREVQDIQPSTCQSSQSTQHRNSNGKKQQTTKKQQPKTRNGTESRKPKQGIPLLNTHTSTQIIPASVHYYRPCGPFAPTAAGPGTGI